MPGVSEVVASLGAGGVVVAALVVVLWYVCRRPLVREDTVIVGCREGPDGCSGTVEVQT